MDEPIAIIGAGLRFPGGNSALDAFTEFLRAGRSAAGPLPTDRWGGHVTSDDIAAMGINVTAGGFLDRIDEFDAQFFGIPPAQAAYVDPHQRLLLETAWEALENANADPAALRHGDGGVYVGATPIDFLLELAAVPSALLDANLATGIGGYSMSGRLSYFLGWRGPSLTVDTACASSLTALHLAVCGLRRGETSIALCGGVNVLHHPRSFAILCRGGMLAPDGRCKAFDESADGYGRAEGCGVLVLKRASDARVAGDTILALIRGTAIGQDGESAGMTAPNGTAQMAVMRSALADAGLEPRDIQYVEAHGTGTPLGDPIEMSSIDSVFGAAHDAEHPLTVGGLKPNLGHMEAAAGLGAILKVVSQMRARQFFPHLLKTPSGRIPWDVSDVRVPARCLPWAAPVRRAIVNGFGVAGAIGIAVLEEAPGDDASRGRADRGAADRGTGEGHVFTLSAKSASALRAQAARYRDFIAADPAVPVADVCYTRATGRAHFRHRLAGVVRDAAGLDALLARHLERDDAGSAGNFRKVALLFPGSGSQYAGMGSALYERFGAFRDAVGECDAVLSEHVGRSVADVMLGRAPDSEQVLSGTVGTHTALFTLEYALARMWLSWGIRPTVLVGHSVGEVVAATVAGLFSLSDGAAFLVARARLVESVRVGGGMAAVAAAAADVAPLLAPWPDLGIAAINAPEQCVISGASGSLADAVAMLAGHRIEARQLNVSSPFHSPLIAGVSGGLRTVLAGVRFGEPTITIVSNLTGAAAPPAELATPDYWIRHLREPVNFARGIRSVGERGNHVFLEAGPSATLTSLARQCLDPGSHRWLTSLHPKDESADTVCRALAGLYTAGLRVSWADVFAGQQVRNVPLPSYVFDRRSYRLPATSGTAAPARPGDGGPPHPPDPAATWQPEPGPGRSAPRTARTGQDDAVNRRRLTGQVLAAMAQAERDAALGDVILGMLGELLGAGDVDPEAPFLELGVDSMLAVRLKDRLEGQLGLRFDASEVFGCATPAELTEFAGRRLAERLPAS